MQQDPWRAVREAEFSQAVAAKIPLNHAGSSPAPARVVRAVTEAVQQSAADPVGFFVGTLARRESARKRMGRLMNVPAEQIALVKNTGHALSIVADGLILAPGDNVVMADCEYPAVTYPWFAQSWRGVETRLVPTRPDGTLTVEDFAAKMDSKTRAVALSWVQFGTGFRADLKAFADLAHAYGALLIVDVIQGLGVLPLDLTAAGADIAATGVHKWQLSPGGTGALWIAPHALERMRLVNMGAGAVVNIAKFDPLDFDPKPNAQRYEEGTPNGLGLCGLDAGLSLLEEIGIDAIGPRVLSLADQAARLLESKGYSVVSPREDARRAGIVLFRHAEYANEDVLKRLEDAGVSAAIRGGKLRFSPHFYNTEDDLERAVAALP